MADWYQIKKYDLGEARTNQKITDFPEDGDCILVLLNENTALAKIYLKFDSQNAHAFDIYKHRKLRHRFRTLYLTNVVASDKKLILLIGKGRWDVERHYPEEQIYTVNADTVDSLHASASIEAGKLLALDSEGKFPNTVLDGMQSELDANRPATPAVGDVFIARDTRKLYICCTAGTWTDITGLKSLFDANTILKADTDDTPEALTIAEQRLVGRITGGNIAALTAAQVVTMLGLKKELGWALLDNAYIGTGLGYFLVGPGLANSSISKVKIYAATAPTGASLIVDVNKNGTTIFTTQGNRPEIAISGNGDDSGTPDVTTMAEGDRLSFDIDQIGSTVAGGNPLLVTVVFT